MGFRKTVEATENAEAVAAGFTPAIPAETPIGASSDEAQPEPLPEPVTAIEADGTHRPMSGGSFIRLEDGTLIRNPEA